MDLTPNAASINYTTEFFLMDIKNHGHLTTTLIGNVEKKNH